MIDNEEIAGILEEVAVYLELNGENPFKVRAYENAARAIRSLSESLSDRYNAQTETLEIKIRGVGSGLEEKIIELLQKKELPLLEELKAQTPSSLLDILKIPGLGAKKVFALNKHLGISTPHELEEMAKKNKIRDLDGFGPKSEENILKGLALLDSVQNQYYYQDAADISRDMSSYLTENLPLDKIECAGSLRRKKEVIGDIDIVLSSRSMEVMDVFTSHPEIKEVLARGNTKSSVILKSGIQVDLRKVKQSSFPFALLYFTGSKEHNTRLRKIALEKGFKLNEYGLYDKKDTLIDCQDEAAIYKHLGLHYIPPELREDSGEFEYFKDNTNISLVQRKDIKGLIHCHTTMSDGRVPLQEIIQKAIKEGYEYIGISDHSRTAHYAGGLTVPQLEKQWAELEEYQQKYSDIRLLKGIESDILPDGNLDYPQDILEKFDFIIASVHSHFKMERQEMTDRIIKAIRNPYTTILGHPTGRLLLQRPPYAVDMEQVLHACRDSGTWIEINGQPKRMDLDWREVIKANDMGIKLVITPDGHSLQMFEDIPSAVNVARKGWTKPGSIMNTMSAGEFKEACLKLRKQKILSSK